MFIPSESMNFVPKRWGHEVWIVNNDKYCGKILFIRKGKYCSYHKHLIKDEVLYVQSGSLHFIYENEYNFIVSKIVNTGEAFHVAPGMSHQMYAIEDVHIVEFSTHHDDKDSYRETTDLVLNSGNSL